MDVVYIIYRQYYYNGFSFNKVEAVFKDEDRAREFAEWAMGKWDEKFGIVLQEWILDDEEDWNN